MIEHESRVQPGIVSSTDDYGHHEINSINHEQLEEKYRTADMLDPYQNVYCGIKIIVSYIEKYTDYGNAFSMAYNMGEYVRKRHGRTVCSLFHIALLFSSLCLNTKRRYRTMPEVLVTKIIRLYNPFFS